MCRGLALGIDKKMNIICVGKSGHTESKLDTGDYLKLELIIDDSNEDNYVLELDKQTNDTTTFSMFLTKNCKLKKETRDYVMKWIKVNEIQVLKWLLVNTSYMRSKEVQDMNSCESEGDQTMSSCKAKGNQYMGYCKAKGNQDMNSCESEGNQNMSNCKAKGNQYMSYCKAKGNQYMSSCEAKGNQDMSCCKAKKRIISYMKSDNKENNEFIKMLSDNAENRQLYWDYLVELARKGYEVNKNV